MSKKVVIIGSATLQEKIQSWKFWWEEKGCEVIDYPRPIPADNFLKFYPEVHQNFYSNLMKADIIFVMNENKNGVTGYIGAESFAEMAFGVAQNLVHDKSIEILLLQMPEEKVQSYSEVDLWLELGWIKLFSD